MRVAVSLFIVVVATLSATAAARDVVTFRSGPMAPFTAWPENTTVLRWHGRHRAVVDGLDRAALFASSGALVERIDADLPCDGAPKNNATRLRLFIEELVASGSGNLSLIGGDPRAAGVCAREWVPGYDFSAWRAGDDAQDDGNATGCADLLLAVRVLGADSGVGYASDLAAAVAWASGAVSFPVGGRRLVGEGLVLAVAGEGECPPFLDAALAQALAAGASLHIGDTGGDTTLFFPSNCPALNYDF